MANKFFETVKRLFGGNKEQGNSAGASASGASSNVPASNTTTTTPTNTPTATPVAKPATPYQNNTVIRKSQDGMSGIYQYNSPDKFKTQKEIDAQWKIAGQLGLTRDQAIEALRSGTRWKQVALGKSGNPISQYQTDQKFKTQQEIDEQWEYARRLGLGRDEAIKALRSGTRWTDQALEPQKQLWEDEAYMQSVEDRPWYKKVLNTPTNLIAKSFMAENQNQEELIESQLYRMGYTKERIEEMRKTGEFDKLLEGNLSQYETKQDATFMGQAEANFWVGYLQQQADALLGQGVLYGDQAMIEQGNALRKKAAEYAQMNEEALTAQLHYDLPEMFDWAEGAVDTAAGWLSKDMAQYLPQRLFQTAVGAPAQLITGGLPAGKLGDKLSMGLSQGFGSGTWMYSTTLGSRYADFVDRGVDPVVAAKIAKDESALSSLLEGSDEAFDWTFGVAGNLAGKSGLFEGLSEKASRSLLAQLSKELVKWGWNTHQEGAQEAWQEMVSMANERRIADGNVDGGFGELLKYWFRVMAEKYPEMYEGMKANLKKDFPHIFGNLETKGMTEDAERLWEARRGGMIIGGIGGIGGTISGIADNAITRTNANRYFDSFVATVDPESLAQMSDQDIDVMLANAEALGRDDAVEILEEEANKRIDKKQQGNIQNNTAADETVSTKPVNQMTLQDLQEIAYDNIANLSDEQLQKYTDLLRKNFDFYRTSDEANVDDIVDNLREDLNAALAEGSRRQNAAKEAASPTTTTTEPTSEATPSGGEEDVSPETKAVVKRPTLLRKYGNAVKKLQSLNPDTDYQRIQSRGSSDEEIQAELDKVNQLISEAQNKGKPVEQSPSGEYNDNYKLAKGDQANGSDQGNGQAVGSDNRQASSVGGETPSSVSDTSTGVEEERPGEGRRAEATEKSGDRRSEAEESADTAAERAGERGDNGNKAVQRSVSKERSRRAEKVTDEVEQHFNIRKFLESPRRHFKNVRDMAVHNANVLRAVFGSHENSSKFVKAWMNDPANYLSLILGNESLLSGGGLTDIEKRTAYQAIASNRIIEQLLSGELTAQDIADISGIDLETAESIIANAEKTINAKLGESRILNKDGSFRIFPFRREAKRANFRSGANNAVANIGEGEKVGTAQTLNENVKYKFQFGDKEIATDNSYGNKIYQRGNTYLVVSKTGSVFAEVNEGKDVQDALRKAHAIARRNSPSYDVASVRLFADGMHYNTSSGILMDQENIFRRENMTSVQGSLASDLMNVAYTDMEKGERKATTAWFKVNLGVEKGDRIGSLTSATRTIQSLINSSYPADPNAKRGIEMANGKRYVFFGMTANGAKKGEAIMIDADLYDKVRAASLSGKSESEVKKFNPAKYLTTSATIFTPSNNDLGIKIAPKDKSGKRSPQVAVIGDLYTIRPNTLRQFMRVDNETDEKSLTKLFTDTMVRKLTEQGVSKAEALAQAEKVVPNQVKEIIANNDVGAIVNIMADLMFQATDGTGFVDIPEGSPYEGQSTQFRSLGGFKGQLIGLHFSDYLHAVIPFNENAEYLYRGEDGEITGGFRYQNKETGVEVLDRWGTWIPVKGLKAILFDSTVKFAGEFSSTEDFYNHTGDADLRSIPRENVYGTSVSDGALEGYKLRGLGQLLRSQFNFTDDEVRSVLDTRLNEVVNNIKNDVELAAKLFGVDFDGKAPPKSDSKAYAIWLHGPEFFKTYDGKRWLSDKLGKLVEDMKSGYFPFKAGESSFGFVDPDVIGLVHSMTEITRIYNETGDIVSQAATEGGGFGLDSYAGLTPGQVFVANLSNTNAEGKPDNRTVVGRFPSTKAIDVQVRENVSSEDPRYKRMVEEFGLDKGNTYLAINDTLSMYLDNDYDGDPVSSFQGALAELFEKIRSRDNLDANGKPKKRNVLVATTKGVELSNTETLGATDLGPVEFSHAKADKVEIGAQAILEAVKRYLEVNDTTSADHKGPRPVGVYDNMVERLAAIPDKVLAKAAEKEGMDVRDFRALMEARFGVAYVLSIDYAKTGKDFKDFFTLVEDLDAMLYDIAEENHLISAREVDKNTGRKITKNDSLVPAWWERGGTGKKAKWESAGISNRVDNPNTLLSAIGRLLPSKKNKQGNVDTKYGNWFNHFKRQIGYGDGRRLSWAGGMTASPDVYSFSKDFYSKLANAYSQITASDSKEFLELKERYKKAKQDVKDIDIRSYLLYKHFQQNLGLTNEQFTDLMLMMLSNSNISSGTILSLDQNKFSKSDAELSTADIFRRNVELFKTFEQAVNSLGEIDGKVSTVSEALVGTREKLTKLLDSKKTVLNAVDAAQVTSVAEMQNALEEGSKQLSQDLGDLLESVSSNAKDISTNNLDAVRNTLEEMSDRIAGMKQQLSSSGSVFASGIASEITSVIGDADKEIRDALRQVNTLENSLNTLYNAYTAQTAKLSDAVGGMQTVYGGNTTGLEGLTEDQILNAIGGNSDARIRVRNGGSRRAELQSQSPSGNEAGQGEGSGEHSGEYSIGSGRRSTAESGGSEREITVDSAVEEEIQSGNVLNGERTLSSDKHGNKLVVNVDGKTGRTVFESRDQGGKVRSRYEVMDNGYILTRKQMTKLQKATQDVLKKFGIHVIFTTGNISVTKANNAGEIVCGLTFNDEWAKTGDRFVVANVGNSEGRVTVRHEPIHALISMLGDDAKMLEWMSRAYDSLVDPKTGYLSAADAQFALEHLPDQYKGNKLNQYNEFFANLFSGDSFYSVKPLMGELFMRKGFAEYQKTGTFPILSDLLDTALPNASAEDKTALIDFLADPYTNNPAMYAKSLDGIEAEANSAETGKASAANETTTTGEPSERPVSTIFGKQRKNIAKNVVAISSAAEGNIKGFTTKDKENTAQVAKKLKGFNKVLKSFLNGKSTSADLYLAYGKLKGTLFNDETVDPYFEAISDPSSFVNEDAYNEAVDHAIAKFAAFSKNVLRSEADKATLKAEAKKRNTTGLAKALNFYGSWTLNAPTLFKSLVGFAKGTTGYKLASGIETAEKNMQRHYWGAYQSIEDVAKMDGFKDLMTGKTKVTGNDVPILHYLKALKGGSMTSMEAINLLRMLDSVEYTQGSLENVKGFTLDDGSRVRTVTYVGSAKREQIGKVREGLRNYFENNASPVEKAYYKAMNNVFDYFTPEVRRVGMALNGYVDMIPSDKYSPIRWGKGQFTEENFNPREAQLKVDPRFMKSRVEEAGGYLHAAPMSDVIEQYIRLMSDYLSKGELREELRLMNKTTDSRSDVTLGQIAGENMGADYARFFNNYVRDFIHYSDNSDNFFGKLRQAMQKGVLVGNPSVMMKQSASYLNAASVIDMKYLIRALTPNQFSGDYANGKSGLLEYRRITGNFDPTMTDIFGQKASKNPLVRAFKNGISVIDYKTVKRVYIAACLQVQAENPGLNINSKEFENAVENLFSDAAIQTQPQFDVSLRPENSRTKNEGVRMLSMFRTQQNQNFNKLVTAIGEYQADPNTDTRAVKAATIKGLIGSSLMLAVFTAVSDAILHRKKKYKDEDGEITAESVASRIGIGAAETLAGTVWFGDDLGKFLIDRLGISDSQEFYGLNVGPLTTVYDAFESLGDFIGALGEGKGYVNAGKKFVGYAAQTFGIPLNNIYNYLNSVAMYSLDRMGENPNEYDDLTKWLDNELRAQNQMVKAAASGNEKKTNKMWQLLQKQYKEPEEQLTKQLKADFAIGNISREAAAKLLMDYGNAEDEEAAEKKLTKWQFEQDYPEYKDLSEGYVWKWKNQVEPTGVSLETFYKATKHYADLVKDKENGKDKNAMLTYLTGLGLNDTQLEAMWTSFGSNFYQSYQTNGVYGKYTTYGKPAGIDAGAFTTYYDHIYSIRADKNKKGKTISGSRKKKVITYINSLNLSKAQKRALWKCFYTTKSPW